MDFFDGVEYGMESVMKRINEELGTNFNVGQFIVHLWDVQRKATTLGVPYTISNFMKMKEENQ